MILTSAPSFGQQNNPSVANDVVSILTPSPNAASLGKFLEIPVGEYTGIPKVGVPIWQIKQGDIDLSIDIDYHSGGIKVDDIASWIGTGWSLNAGGEVVRVTRGIPDGYNSQQSAKRYINNEMSESEKQTYINSVYRGNSDSEPDIYMVRAGELGFSFFEDIQGDFHLLDNNPNVKIQRDVNGIDWLVTSGKGVKYKFGAREYTEVDSRFRRSDANEVDGGYFSDVSTWYLTEVEDTKNNKVTFEYANNILSYLTRGVEKVKVPMPYSTDCQQYSEYNYSYNTISGKRLQTITYSSGKVNFYEGSARLDCNGDKAIDRIEVVNTSNELIKRFKFFTSYFENNALGTSGLNYYSGMDQKRLRLDSLREESNNMVNKPYKFSYFVQQGLPYRNSNAQDYWGYFNGENNTTSVSYYDGTSSSRQGANKNINGISTKELSLSSITYPTGGSTFFELENNSFMMRNNNQSSATYLEQEVTVGNLTGNNDNSGNDFHFEKTFTITEEDLQGKSSTDAWFRLYTEGLQSGTSATIATTMTWPDGITRGLQVGVFNVYHLVAGNYKVNVDIVTEYAGVPYVYFSSSLYFKKFVSTNPGNNEPIQVPGPGLRVKRITKVSTNQPNIIEEYTYNDPITGLSSGLVGSIPDYFSTQTVVGEKYVSGGAGGYTEYYNCNYNIYSSASNRSLANTKGSFVGYSYVTKKSIGTTDIGKVVSRFTNFSEFNDLNSSIGFPFPPNSSQDWKRGLPLKKILYNADGTIRQSESYGYQVVNNSTVNNFGLKIGANTLMNYTGANESQIYGGLSVVRYDISTDAYKIAADTVIEVNNGMSNAKKNFYSYSINGFNLKEIESDNSDDGSKVIRFYYPKDYSSMAGSSSVLSSLLEYNILDQPIEQIVVRKKPGVETMVDGIVNEYGYDTFGQNKIFSMRRILKADVDQMGLTDRYDFLHIPNYYKEKVSYTHNDSNGKPGTVKINSGSPSSYLYSYNKQYPIAEIKNADYATVESILGAGAIESFSNQVSPDKAAVDAFLAPLKANLPAAFISTYTYKPLVGMTTQTDAKGMTTYYEYDEFQRLKYVKDQDGNIVKSNTYHYKN